MYSSNVQYSKMFGGIQKSFTTALNCIAHIQHQVCNGYFRKRWSVASVLAVTSHKESIRLVHFQCCRLWKSIFLIVCKNWSICVTWTVLLSQLLNSNFKFYILTTTFWVQEKNRLNNFNCIQGEIAFKLH